MCWCDPSKWTPNCGSPMCIPPDVKVTQYPITDDEAARLERCFTYHPPKGDQAVRYERLRACYRELAKAVLVTTPPGRERALALTKLEESVMWANAAIARGE